MANGTGNEFERLLQEGVVRGQEVVARNASSGDKLEKEVAVKILALSTEISRLVIAKNHHGKEMPPRWNTEVNNQQHSLALLFSEIGRRVKVSNTGFGMLGFPEVVERLSDRIKKIDAGINRLSATLQNKIHPIKSRQSRKRRPKK